MDQEFGINNWQNFQKEVSSANFYQSYQWARTHQQSGGKFFLWQIKDAQKIKAGAIILKYNLPLNKSYLFVPLGPIGEMTERNWLDFILNAKEIAKNERAFFIRFYAENINKNSIKSHNIKEAPKNYFLSAGNIPLFNARLCLISDESVLLKNFRQKTRYNINLAKKRGVNIKFFSGGDAFKKQLGIFFNLLKSTAQKKDFSTHHQSHYEGLIKNFGKDISLFMAYYKDIPIAAALCLKWNDAAYYLHGGTDFNFRNLMAPHLLHWEIIKFYRNNGARFYDFGAISVPELPVKKWNGITRFKLAFGATPYSLAQAYDLIINKSLYFLYNLIRKIL